jgi:hypothetical protein
LGPKILVKRKRNLIWSENCLGQSRTFLYNPKTYRSKQKYFDLVHLLSEQQQIVLIWSAYCQNESKTIDLLRKLSQLYNLTPWSSTVYTASCGKGYTPQFFLLHSCGNGYTLHVHSAALLWTWSTSILLAVERNTTCTSILLHVHSAA